MPQPPMEDTDLLVRLRPALQEIFAAYEISEAEAREILEDACGILVSKRWDRQNPGRWLVRTVIERCRSVALGCVDERQD